MKNQITGGNQVMLMYNVCTCASDISIYRVSFRVHMYVTVRSASRAVFFNRFLTLVYKKSH